MTEDCSRDLKILIVSTPKTGNTWVKHLLAQVYNLPLASVGTTFDVDEIARLGSRWVAHQHFYPHDSILNWCELNKVQLVTTMRHPGDVLVSLFHYMHNFEFAEGWAPRMMRKDEGTMGQYTRTYLRTEIHFSHILELSLAWGRTGRAHLVRYEALRRDPEGILQVLTDALSPVPMSRVEQAVEACRLDRMRKEAGKHARFFRKGHIGGWQQALPADILDILRTQAPYPRQIADLGYSLDMENVS